jgi:hypothetical protein
MPVRRKDHQRFWSKVLMQPGCWEWAAATDRNGHGVFWLEGRLHGAHRVAWKFAFGAWPETALRHTCDNRSCIRVSHLIEGDQTENMADMVARGRQCRGEAKPNATLSTQDVVIIRREFAAGAQGSDLARRFRVHRTTIRDVVSLRRWIHVEA